MKAKALTLLALMITTVTVAQPADYYIQVNQPSNLRSTYDLNSPVVEVVPADTTLHVVYEGVQGNWLQVERNGNRYWMARWVSHRRATSAQPAPASPSSLPQTEIDNLCFTTWHCETPEEWEAGYYRYQNSQGATPSQPGTVYTKGNSFSWSGSGERRLDGVSVTRGSWYYEFIPTNSWGYIDEAAIPNNCIRGFIGDNGFVEVQSEPCTLHIAVANNPGSWTLTLSKTSASQLQSGTSSNSYSWNGNGERNLGAVTLTRGSWYYQFDPTNSWGYLDEATVPSDCMWGFIGDNGFAEVRSEPCTVHIAVANNPGSWTLTLSRAGASQLQSNTSRDSYSWNGDGEHKLGEVSLTRGRWYYQFDPTNSWGYLDEAAIPNGCMWGFIGDNGFVEVRSEPCTVHIAVANNPGMWTLSLDKAG